MPVSEREGRKERDVAVVDYIQITRLFKNGL